jgi:hypothetical protein
MRCGLTTLTIFVLMALACTICSATGDTLTYSDLAQHLLEHIKYGEPHTGDLTSLQIAEPSALYKELQTDSSKKAFWINLYNTFAQLQMQKKPELYNDKIAFFKSRNFIVAGYKLSLDDIEHRLLRRAEPAFLPGFIRPFFMSGYMRRLSLTSIDPRMHFALNCNAHSCPPILFYEPGKIDEQLDKAALNYLTTSVIYDAKTNVVQLPELFSWFPDDFGKRQGIIELLRRYTIIGQNVEPIFTYAPWNWAPEPGHFN